MSAGLEVNENTIPAHGRRKGTKKGCVSLRVAMHRKRSRLTQYLIARACERFHACEVCFKSEACDVVEDALAPLRLKPRELKRLLQGLTCPCCESRVCEGTLVVTLTC